jgi:ketosteroid isomerase-like protein
LKKGAIMNNNKENIKIIEQMYSFFSKKDINSIIKMLSLDVEWGEPENPYNPAAGMHHGHKGFLEWVEIGSKAEEILVLDPRKMLTDHDSVAVFGYLKCKVVQTGKIYESDFVHLITLKEGKIIKFQEFFDTYAAGEAFRK